LAFALGDSKRRINLLAKSLDWSRVIVAKRNGQPVGFVLLRFAGRGPFRPRVREFMAEYGTVQGVYAALVFYIAEFWGWRSPFYIYTIRVPPKERGRGIGEALLKAAIAHARNAGYDSVSLHVGANFATAKRLYERCGFVESGHASSLPLSKHLPFSQLVYMTCCLKDPKKGRDA
jgi:ribosomal protein S18 acetylase RimI-like enzyme